VRPEGLSERHLNNAAFAECAKDALSLRRVVSLDAHAEALGFGCNCGGASPPIYEKILDGKILMMVRYADTSADAGIPQNPQTAARIMHARLQVGDRLLVLERRFAVTMAASPFAFAKMNAPCSTAWV
jgi:hypothetical protein